MNNTFDASSTQSATKQQISLNMAFPFKSYLAIFLLSDLECKLSVPMRTYEADTTNIRSFCVNLGKHLRFTASYNQTL